jgi:Uma2 family endonuclease
MVMPPLEQTARLTLDDFIRRYDREDYAGKPLVLIPDLVVEVVSVGDTYTEVSDKVAAYLSKEVRLVWVVDPQRKRIEAHTATRLHRLGVDDNLSGEDVLPGLSVPAAALFE